MTSSDDPNDLNEAPSPSPERRSDADDQALKALLKQALPAEGESPDVLGGVQKKIRARSGGKFYGSRWTTEKHPPIRTYLITTLLMLAFCAVTYVFLRPLAGTAQPVSNEPAPINVVAPASKPSP